MKNLLARLINRETLSYVIVGGITTLLDWGIFTLLVKVFSLDHLLANIISTACAILFAFVANKYIVFRSLKRDKGTLLRELSRFAASRLFTFLLQELLLFITVNLLHFDSVIMKMATSILVIILNYFLSKLFIFKKEPSHEDQTQLQ